MARWDGHPGDSCVAKVRVRSSFDVKLKLEWNDISYVRLDTLWRVLAEAKSREPRF